MDLSDLQPEDVFELSEAAIQELEEAIFGEVYQPLQKYCPHGPWPKQRAFLNCKSLEVFFGGSAGPGKSDALLMAALQYVHVPGYSCLILRRDFQRLSLPGSIMARAREWLSGTDAKWNGSAKSFIFPSGATIQFGYIDNNNDRFRYASSEFSTIIWDELTEFDLADDESNPYLFLFSRLRKSRDIPVPLRMLSASNPGNVGHAWVKKRFITDESIQWMLEDLPDVKVFHADASGDRAFIPGVLRDNPAVDPDEYIPSLSHLPHVTQQRLLRGDWSIREDSIISPDAWQRYAVSPGGEITIADAHGQVLAHWPESESYRFVTCDPAGTSQDRARVTRGHDHSWTVAGVWDRSPADVGRYLVLRHVWRRRVGFNGLCDGLRQINTEWQPARIRIENEKLGTAAVEILSGEMPIDTVPTQGKDKLTRATTLLQALERGEVALPSSAPWLDAYESEVYQWTGHPDEVSDQVDMSAYAAIEASGRGFGCWDPALFGPDAWLDEFPAIRQVLAVVLPCDPSDVGTGLVGTVLAVGVAGDGKLYVNAICEDEPPATLLSRLLQIEEPFGQIVTAVVVPRELVETTQLLSGSIWSIRAAPPDVYAVDLKKSAFTDPTALSDVIRQRRLKFLRNVRGNQILVNRAKSFPHTKDIVPLVALGVAIESLATMFR